ncbi:amino acid adenylation domain-containing protein [Tumebacillus lipolyticus]|uniref:Amino acid adenylation domain-containing protein n=1 Tax=Tumebacillus lipolyticus TaxID=1280370 RepID=A0ABW4ZRX8_9BACL
MSEFTSEAAAADVDMTEEGAGEEVFVFPASFAQQRLWFLDRLLETNALYNIPFAVRFQGRLHSTALEAAIREIVARHEVLRTTFELEEEELIQVVATDTDFTLPILTVSEGQVQELASAEAAAPFDLEKGPLLRAKLLRLAEEEHVLLFTMHHIISDGWSFGVLMRELTALYDAFSKNLPSPLPELPIQYGDYACWQREYLAGEVWDEQLSYWTEQLGSSPPMLQLPFDRPRPPVQSNRGTTESFQLSVELTQALKTYGHQQSATLFMTMLAAFQALLSRICGQDDIAVGTPIAGRSGEETESLIGFFVNTLVIRTDLSDQPSFERLLARVAERTNDAYAHQDIPFEQLVKELQVERDRSSSPLFQVMFALQSESNRSIDLPGLTASPVEFEHSLVKFDLSVTFQDLGDHICGHFSYNTDLFDRRTIQQIIRYTQTLLQGVVEDPHRPVAELALMSDWELDQLLHTWNDTAISYPSCSVSELFERQVESAPQRVAISFEEVELTYGELNRRANRLARSLQKHGVVPEQFVGLCMQRSPEMVVALLAILKAGAAYVPIDPDYPAERVSYLLDDAQVSLLLTQTHLLDRLQGTQARPLCIETEEAAAAEESGEDLQIEIDPHQRAYAIYTSGSTGQPKGVVVSHRSIVNLVRASDYVRFGPDEVFLQVASISFDAATFELWGSLLNGARLVIFPPHRPSLQELGQTVRTAGVTTLWLTAGLFHQMVDEQLADLAGVRQLLAGGDALSTAHVKKLLNALPNTALINGYGPTECTTFACTHTVTSAAQLAATVPIGRPIANTRAYVLDARQQPSPTLVPGELYIGGDGLALGYHNRIELTAAQFVEIELNSGKKERLYRTGDLVRWLPDGTLEFKGRLDHQIKLRGFRIELEEIEAVLMEQAGLQTAMVIARDDASGDKCLVAYLVPEADREVDLGEIRHNLRERLPDYMIPSAFLTLETLPLTANGKVDRKLLPEPDLADMTPSYTAPRTPEEEIVVAVFAHVLRKEQVGIHDDFFALGGHSLLATLAVSRLSTAFDRQLPLRCLFEASTASELAIWIDRANSQVETEVLPPLLAFDRGDSLPLSFAQHRLWVLDQIAPGSSAYNIPYAVRLRGQLDKSILAQSIGEIVRRHEALRTTFAEEYGEPYTIIGEPASLDIELTDLTAWGDEERTAEQMRLILSHSERPFDLQAGPLVRFALLKVDTDEHVLLLNMHHIISDGWSMGVFTRELCELYQAFAQGERSPLPELPIQYADFACWQRQWMQGSVLDRQLSYWKTQLGGELSPLELPTDRPRKAVQTHVGANERFSLSPELSERLQFFSREQGATLFMTLLTAFQSLLARYSGQLDIAVGTPVAGRGREETEGLIGFFVNTLVMRTDLSGQPSFRELLQRVKKVALGAYEHQHVPFEKLVQELQPERDRSRSPLFQVMFLLQNTPRQSISLQGLTVTDIEFERPVSKFDMSLGLTETAEGISGTWTYNTDLFDRQTVKRMIAHFERLLQAMVDQPDQPFTSLQLLSAAEQHQLLIEWNDTDVEYRSPASLHELFERQAAQTPDAPAATFGDQTLTYAELNREANRIAHTLREAGVGPEVLVGICTERSLAMLTATLGVLKAGGAYLPLDPTYPRDRLSFMIADAKPLLLLAQQTLADRLPDFDGTIVPLDAQNSPFSQNDDNPELRTSEDQLAYVTYTSGSTGTPKGVMSVHRGAVNYLQYIANTYRLDAEDRVLQIASYSFDASVRDMLGPLITGAHVILVPDEVIKHPPALLTALQEHRVTALLSIVPTLLQALTQATESAAVRAESVRLVLTSGEVLYRSVVEQARAAFHRDVVIVNQYGPTECTMTSTYRQLEPTDLVRTEMLAGRPIPNNRLYVLDEAKHPVPIGVAGEVYLGGAGVTRGYLNRPELTADSFLANPFRPEERLYKTGDRARLLADGTLEFLGRLDNQVKLRGLRIELGEVQAALTRHPLVQDAVVIVRTDAGIERLVAYFITEQGSGEVESGQLRQFLHESLPEYMLPSVFVRMERFPLSANGKLDRRALPTPQEGIAKREYVAPRTPVEEVVASVWEEVLGVEKVGARDDFFELGGHSLLATQIVSRLNAAFQLQISLQRLFEAHTVETLASVIDDLLFDEILKMGAEETE